MVNGLVFGLKGHDEWPWGRGGYSRVNVNGRLPPAAGACVRRATDASSRSLVQPWKVLRCGQTLEAAGAQRV